MKKHRIKGFVLLLVLGLTACSPGEEKSQDIENIEDIEEAGGQEEVPSDIEGPKQRIYEGSSLSLLTYTDEMDPFIAQFEDETGCQVMVSEIDHLDYQEKVETLFEEGGEGLDLLVSTPDTLATYMTQEYYASLDKWMPEDPWEDLVYDYIIQAGTSGGDLRALSFQANVGGLFYRQSLLDEVLGEGQAVSDFTQSYAGLIDLARQAKAAGYYLLADPSELDVFSNQDQVAWVDEAGQLYYPPSRDAFLDMVRVFKEEELTPEIKPWSQAWFDLMYQDQVLSYPMAGWGMEYILKKASPDKGEDQVNPTTGDWGIAPGPVPFYAGGTWIGISQTSKKQEEAAAFIRFLMEGFKDQLPSWQASAYVESQTRPDAFLKEMSYQAYVQDQGPQIKYYPKTEVEMAMDDIFMDLVQGYSQGRIGSLDIVYRLLKVRSEEVLK